jgi:hypothetical protein
MVIEGREGWDIVDGQWAQYVIERLIDDLG